MWKIEHWARKHLFSQRRNGSPATAARKLHHDDGFVSPRSYCFAE